MRSPAKDHLRYIYNRAPQRFEPTFREQQLRKYQIVQAALTPYFSDLPHCAIIDLKEFDYSYRFFENVARNRGYELRIFSDTDEAIAWLKK